jgi:hypothetical protein
MASHTVRYYPQRLFLGIQKSILVNLAYMTEFGGCTREKATIKGGLGRLWILSDSGIGLGRGGGGWF